MVSVLRSGRARLILVDLILVFINNFNLLLKQKAVNSYSKLNFLSRWKKKSITAGCIKKGQKLALDFVKRFSVRGFLLI